MEGQSLQDQLHEIIKETYNCEFRLTCNSIEWSGYIVRTKTNYKGTFEEVVRMVIDEFMSYRKIVTDNKHIKNHKKYRYD